MLIFGRVHVAAQLVRRRPQRRLQSERRLGRRAPTILQAAHGSVDPELPRATVTTEVGSSGSQNLANSRACRIKGKALSICSGVQIEKCTPPSCSAFTKNLYWDASSANPNGS